MKGERKKTRAENLGKRKKRAPYQPFLGNPALLIIHIFPLLQFPPGKYHLAWHWWGKKSRLQNFLNPPSFPDFNNTHPGWHTWIVPIAPHFHLVMTLHLWSPFLTSTKQEKLPLKAAVVAMQETATPKHTDFLCKVKAEIFVFGTFVALRECPKIQLSFIYFSQCPLQQGKWAASCWRTKFWVVFTFLSKNQNTAAWEQTWLC